MKSYIYKELEEKELEKIIARPSMDFATVSKTVQPIIDAVKVRGNKAVTYYTEQFDGVRPDPLTLNPNIQQVTIPEHVKRAIDHAYDNIRKFHAAQFPPDVNVQTEKGVQCFRETRPIESVGLYVPGGTAKLPSTALMLAVPAKLAGCPGIIMATPPDNAGKVAPEIIYIAQKTGIHKIVVSGGAQAIAAMAYGTETIPKVDKLFGPGNQYVTAAKMILQNSDARVGMDLPAGPSEVLVIADGKANPVFVAADLLSQAEHGVDSQVALLVTADFDKENLQTELESQLKTLPRADIAGKSLDNSFIIEVESLDEAFRLSNRYAPEHLIVNVEDPERYVGQINHAGSVFLGPWTPESVGDYASGTNHTLPTNGFARMFSGVSVENFQKNITFQRLTKQGLKGLSNTVQTLADIEELEAHRLAVAKRMEAMDEYG